MRTTIRIDDALYRRAKERAARTGTTVSEVIEGAVREALRPQPTEPSGQLPELPVYGGSGTMPGVELADNAALRDVMDESEDLGALR